MPTRFTTSSTRAIVRHHVQQADRHSRLLSTRRTPSGVHAGHRPHRTRRRWAGMSSRRRAPVEETEASAPSRYCDADVVFAGPGPGSVAGRRASPPSKGNLKLTTIPSRLRHDDPGVARVRLHGGGLKGRFDRSVFSPRPATERRRHRGQRATENGDDRSGAKVAVRPGPATRAALSARSSPVLVSPGHPFPSSFPFSFRRSTRIAPSPARHFPTLSASPLTHAERAGLARRSRRTASAISSNGVGSR